MTPFMIVSRLVLPSLLAGFLLLSLGYWWLDNLPHEIFGTTMFALLAWHIAVNRSWFKQLLKGRYDARRIATLALHLVLVANMVVLFGTSIVISKSVFAALPIPDSIYLRDVHWFSAYWVMIIVGVHLGLHWRRVMNRISTMAGSAGRKTLRTGALRALMVLITCFGVWSFSALDVANKLTFTYSLEFWDFTASVTPFFLHWAGVVALPAIVTHYLLAWWSRRRGAAIPANQRLRPSQTQGTEEGAGA